MYKVYISHEGLNGSMYCMFLGNCPPTPPQTEHKHLLLTLGKMLGLGRGRWTVSQKHTLL